ncbi:MAG: alpha/beta hydrolase [Methanothrix sp.]|nr:MAG: alpha/beta hydrolase [Methanothrix sp.]
MQDRRINGRMMVIGLLIVLAVLLLLFGNGLLGGGSDWRVTDEGLLQYSVSTPKYQHEFIEEANNSTLYAVSFASRDRQMDALLRIPWTNRNSADGTIEDGNSNNSVRDSNNGKKIPGIVLLPGATVTKEREQGLAKYLSGLGFASITLDQRNLGGTDQQGDWQMFMQGSEPIEHKMVYDALAAAEILRAQPNIDPSRIIYAGESNGGRFAIMACALDEKAKGVLAISTCGYGTEDAVSAGRLTDPEMIKFLRSVDPETYLARIAPRPFVMIHSRNDTVIPFDYAEGTFARAFNPKSFHAVGCTKHGYCTEMNTDIEEELKKMAS